MKKLFTYSVVIATIVWSLGLAAVVPLATATYSPSAGDLVKTANDSAVYYIDSEGERHLFSNAVTYWTWYSGTWADQDIMTISQEDFDALEVADNVVARAGVSLVKFENSPKTYAVLPGGVLAHVTDEDAAIALFGSDWLSKVILIQNAFETNYSKTGDDLTSDSNLPDGSLIKYEGSDDIYYIEDGEKRLVEDDAFVANSFKDSAVLTVATSMTFDTGESITGEEAALSTVAGPESADGGVASGTSLTVALSGDTPAAGLAIYNAARVPFTTIDLTASADGDITVDSVVIERTGASADTSFSSVALIDGDTNVQIGLNQNLNSSHTANVNNDFTVPAGTTKQVILAGNMGAVNAGQTPSLTLAEINLKNGATVVGSLPISGNAMSMTNLTIGQVTVARGSLANSTSTTLKVGTEEYIIAAYKFTADSTEGQKIQQVKFYNSGTASLSSDLDNYQLLLDNTTAINAVFTVDGKYLTAEFSSDSVDMDKGKNKQIVLKADVVGGSTRTIKMNIYRTTDVVAEGADLGYTRTAAYSGTGLSTANPVMSSNQFTISSGTLRVDKSQTIGATDVSYGDNQILGAFEFVVAGEPVSITQLVLTNSSTTVDSDNIDNVKLVDASTDETYWGPSSADATGADDITYTSTVEMPVGTTVVNVVADVESTGGFATNETFYYTINPSNITATGASTDETVTATPSAAVSASTMTFKPGKLTILQDSSPIDSNVVVGTSDHLFAAWVFDAAGSGEDVRVTTITFGNEAATTTNVDSLTLYDTTVAEADCTSEYADASWNSEFGCQLSPISDGASGTTTVTLTNPMVITKNTSKTVQLRGDVRTGVAGNVNDYFIRNEAAGTTAPITAKGVLTDNAITPTGNGYNATDGADITVASAGTLTINTSAATPASKLLAEGQTYEVGRIKLTATNETIKVTDLSINLEDGGLTGTAAGDQTEITNVEVWNGTNKIIDSPLNATRQDFSIADGDLEVPIGSSGVELVVKVTLALVDNSVITEAGLANADFKIGIGGTDGIRGSGIDSGTTVSETYTDSTSSGMIIHKGYPTVTINDPDSTLTSGANIFDFTVNNPTGETIAIYQLAFQVSTSSGDLTVTTAGLEAKLSSWSSFKQISGDVAITYLQANDAYYGFELWDQDSTSKTQKELQIAAGASAQFRMIARAVTGLDGTAGESIQVRLLGDNASSTGNAGNTANAFEPYPAVGNGNFVWSDLYENTGSTSNGATSTTQWYNGYLVDGLSVTSTVKTISE